MKRGGKGPRRRMSTGTVFMLVLLAVTLAGSALVLGRLSSGQPVDLRKLNVHLLDIRETAVPETPDEKQASAGKTEKQPDAAPVTPPPVISEAPAAEKKGSTFELTAAGSIALTGEVRKNSWSSDARVYDYSDMMMLIAPKIRADASVVFTENLFCDNYKVNDTVAPESAAGLVKEAGFTWAASGFSQGYSHGKDGIETTLMALDERGVTPLGMRYADDNDIPNIRTIGGVKTVFLQYTASVSAKTRKSMEREGATEMIPDANPERIARDISAARERGAEAVIVLFSWGRIGKDPDSSQKELASAVAKAGADLIIGNGSHIPQSAEYLTGRDGNAVLCVWSLGSLLSGDRANAKRMSGYLLHVTIRSNGRGGVDVLNPEYTPVYTWKYKQDGRYYYRCITVDGTIPDGMDSEQIKSMNKTDEVVTAVMKNSPLSRRGGNNAD